MSLDFTDELEPIEKGQTIFLGVIGGRADATQEKIVEDVLTPILQELGRMPERVILPAESVSNIYISDWADTLKIQTQIYEAEWHRHQRRAKIFRDARIQQESTHFIVFLNKRSEYNEKLAMRLARQGHTVFTVAYSDWLLEQLTSEEPDPASSESQSARPAKRGSKPDTGKGTKRPGSGQTAGLGSQLQLTGLWAT